MLPLRRLLPLLCLLLLPAASPGLRLEIEEVGLPGAPGEDGETVSASGDLVGVGEPVELLVSARGGLGGSAPPGGTAGNGGGATLGPVFAVSTGGDVVSGGAVVGGPGGMGSFDDPAGDGASVEVVNAVDGESDLSLLLAQTAIGGDAGAFAGGTGGSARSVLQRRKSAESLEVVSQAMAGGPPLSFRIGPAGGLGAPAEAVGAAHNDTGSVSAQVFANGGRGGVLANDLPGLPGGEARVRAFARSRGDGNPVIVGSDPGFFSSPPFGRPVVAGDLAQELFRTPGAVGGAGGGFSPLGFDPTPSGGPGGEGRSLSVGIAGGDSEVRVFDNATGGAGGGQKAVVDGLPRGGDAHSRAYGGNRGASSVSVFANARGGIAGPVGSGAPPSPLPGAPGSGTGGPPGGVPGGDANARVFAWGGGEVIAEAKGGGGRGTIPILAVGSATPGGVGRALATAMGSAGEVRATAESYSPNLEVVVAAGAALHDAATAVSHVGPDEPRAGRGDARAAADVAPSEEDVARLLDREPAFAEAFEKVEALGKLGARQTQRGRGQSVVTRLEVFLKAYLAIVDSEDVVSIGLFAPRLRRLGFESLRVTLVKNGETLLDELFTNAREARRFLDGLLLEVGPIDLDLDGRLTRADIASLTFELTTRRRGAAFEVGFAVGSALPEP